MTSTLYDTDFYAWANEQAALLRAGKLDAADIEHIAEEIESIGRRERRELIDRLTVLLTHLLRWQRQPVLRGGSWRLSIEAQRVRLAQHLDDNPSLMVEMDGVMERAYRVALIKAARKTGFPPETFSAECPFTFAEVVDDDFWPD